MEPLLVTGIGSLPHRDPVAATAFVSRFAPQLPFWPQLPQASPRELMVAQAARGTEPWTDAVASGLSAFERGAKRGMFKDAVAVKGQLIGPVTLALAEGHGGFTLDALAETTERVAGLARAQIQRLTALGKPVVVFLDEPALGALPAGLTADERGAAVRVVTATLEVMRGAGARAGLHCCAAPPLQDLEALAPDVLSFDAELHLDAVIGDARVARWLGGTERVLAFGLVPPLRKPDVDELFRRAVKIPPSWLRQSWITPTCGIASGSIAAAEQVFDAALALATRLRGALP